MVVGQFSQRYIELNEMIVTCSIGRLMNYRVRLAPLVPTFELHSRCKVHHCNGTTLHEVSDHSSNKNSVQLQNMSLLLQ